MFLAVKESLIKDGHLNKFRAELRAAVMSVLSGKKEGRTQRGQGEKSQQKGRPRPPPIPEETLILNELIREYLDWNGYRYSEQILVAGMYILFVLYKN